MGKRSKSITKKPDRRLSGIVEIVVSGYKSIRDEVSIPIRPLTLLAGTNSSGKSSFMQPVLLLKQTLEASYDPGALLLNGPNVLFTSADDLFWHSVTSTNASSISIGIRCEDSPLYTMSYDKQGNKGINLSQMTITDANHSICISPDIKPEELLQYAKERFYLIGLFNNEQISIEVVRNRCFFGINLLEKNNISRSIKALLDLPLVEKLDEALPSVIHLPGLRGNPRREYPVSAVGPTFPGTYENYVASIISHWQEENNDNLLKLGKNLELLGLTWRVHANPINDTQVKIMVGRLNHYLPGSDNDLVSIADVGLGVSQTLPVLVALLVAAPGQLVYLEQPEIHLHPSAQYALAQVIADAAIRGVKVVVETHSSLLLLGIQTLIAKKQLSNDIVGLHWFQRDTLTGATTISSADIDTDGAFGDWPVDFDDVTMKAQQAYLDASF